MDKYLEWLNKRIAEMELRRDNIISTYGEEEAEIIQGYVNGLYSAKNAYQNILNNNGEKQNG